MAFDPSPYPKDTLFKNNLKKVSQSWILKISFSSLFGENVSPDNWPTSLSASSYLSKNLC